MMPEKLTTTAYMCSCIGQATAAPDLLCPHSHRVKALSDDVHLRCVCAYIGPKSRTERPRKTKIGTEVAHITHD